VHRPFDQKAPAGTGPSGRSNIFSQNTTCEGVGHRACSLHAIVLHLCGPPRSLRRYKALEAAVRAAPDKQISLTDPDARSMATSGKDTGLVGYNVQAVVDTQHHLIVVNEVINIGNDRSQLSTMARQTQEATGVRELTAIADLQRRRDSGPRGDGRDAARSEAADLRRQSGRPVRQAGFRPRRGRSRSRTSCL
jgi:hypothetical protein